MIEFFVKRPVTLFSVYAVISVLGIISLVNLPVELYPDTEYPTMSVSVNWQDASPELVEREITRKIESEVFRLQGVRNVSSRSSRGQSTIEIEFEGSVDVTYQKVLLTEALSGIEFPIDARAPEITERSPDEFESGYPVVLSVSGPYDLVEMGEKAREIEEKLERVDGVKNILVYGDPEKEIRVEIFDPRFSPFAVLSEFMKEDFSAGRIKEGGASIPLVVEEQKYPEMMFIYGRDLTKIALVRYGISDPYYLSRVNGNPVITLNIEKRNDIGLLEFSRNIRKAVEDLEVNGEVTVEFERDEADDIRENLKKIAILGIIALVGVSLSFIFTMKDFYSVFLFFLTIAFSTLLTFVCIYFSRLSLNVFTLSGIALGFGMVVDNSIIVLENILRHKEEGNENPVTAGAKEVFLPVIASTFTTIVVFVPFLFFQGTSRQLYVPFALSASFSLLSSIFVAFTLVPILSGRIKPKTAYRPKLYLRTLKGMFKLRWIIMPLAILLILAGAWIFKENVRKGQPFRYGEEDRLYVRIFLPSGSDKSEVLKIAGDFEEEILEETGYEKLFTIILNNIILLEIDYEEPCQPAYALKEKLQRFAVNFANCRIVIIGMGDPFFTGGGGGGGFPQFSLKGYDYYRLNEYAEMVKQKLLQNPRIENVDLNVSFYGRGAQKEFIVSPNRAMPMQGFNPASVANALRKKVTSYLVTDEDRFVLNIFTDSILRKEDLLSLRVQAGFELRDLCSLSEVTYPPHIERENQQYTKMIAYDYQGPYKQAEGFRQAFMSSVHLPEGFELGDVEFYMEEEGLKKKEIIIAIALSIFLLLAVLSSLYESLKKPLLILIVLPISFFGVALVYWLFKKEFDASAFVGLILLLGIAVNDGIVLIDHLTRGKKQDAQEIITRCGHRFRPIVITTLTTLLGLIPFVFSKQDIYVLSKLSISCTGGLVFSTLGSLFILPVFYYTFFGRKNLLTDK
ncbi:efflux RND transporter permease subunit [candidate division WOR-3 bacterium]|nr:efflux RND transporter permease subunit [candidate division WOR-3 bacterium]